MAEFMEGQLLNNILTIARIPSHLNSIACCLFIVCLLLSEYRAEKLEIGVNFQPGRNLWLLHKLKGRLWYFDHPDINLKDNSLRQFAALIYHPAAFNGFRAETIEWNRQKAVEYHIYLHRCLNNPVHIEPVLQDFSTLTQPVFGVHYSEQHLEKLRNLSYMGLKQQPQHHLRHRTVYRRMVLGSHSTIHCRLWRHHTCK